MSANDVFNRLSFEILTCPAVRSAFQAFEHGAPGDVVLVDLIKAMLRELRATKLALYTELVASQKPLDQNCKQAPTEGLEPDDAAPIYGIEFWLARPRETPFNLVAADVVQDPPAGPVNSSARGARWINTMPASPDVADFTCAGCCLPTKGLAHLLANRHGEFCGPCIELLDQAGHPRR